MLRFIPKFSIVSFIHLCLVFILSSCAIFRPTPDTLSLTILHTNDHHGRFWPNREGEFGLPARSTLITQIRQELAQKNAAVLLLDAGDVNTGSPYSDQLQAEPDFKGMSALEYDALALGNHEFDIPLETLKKQQSWAKFPFLSANTYYKGQRLYPPYLSKNIQGIRVAILGLTTLDTPQKSKLGRQKDLVFTDPIEEAKKIVPELKKSHDVIIALTHMGHFENEMHLYDSPGDVTLARQVPGIHLIVGGHTHKALFKPDRQNGTWIVQANEWGKYVGRVDLEVSPAKEVKLISAQLLPINLKSQATQTLAQDKKISDLLRPYYESGKKLLDIHVADVEGDFRGNREINRSQQTALGQLIGASYKKTAQSDIAVINAGGIRDGFSQRSVTYADVLSILPFANELIKVTMTGNELTDYLTHLVKFPPGLGAYAHFHGVSFQVNKERNRLSKIKVGNLLLQPLKKYTLSLPYFCATGGDGWPDLKTRYPFTFTGIIDAEALKTYLLSEKSLSDKNFPLPYK